MNLATKITTNLKVNIHETFKCMETKHNGIAVITNTLTIIIKRKSMKIH